MSNKFEPINDELEQIANQIEDLFLEYKRVYEENQGHSSSLIFYENFKSGNTLAICEHKFAKIMTKQMMVMSLRKNTGMNELEIYNNQKR